ncbi:MAG: ribosome small subunit-dependent GTPase A [Ruminococcaceae bacterium]|nr:ribosome small subunit-dependent GTPase A [Oscillospiraceae bacterium]
MTGIIVKALSSFYYVESNENIYECKARGNFRKSGNSPLVGDMVEFDALDNSHGVIIKILERKNVLKRPNIANVDKLFIVSSYSTPAPNTYIIDKVSAIARYNNIEPIIVFNKSDMGDFSNYLKIYRNAGFKTYVVSAQNGDGIEDLKLELKDSVSAFTGNSGVGKSSILNTLFGENFIATADVSDKLGRGRHTTRHIEAHKLSFGGYVLDTPGFSSIEHDYTDYNFKESLAECFEDFGNRIYNCKYSSCTHTKENGCMVLEAVKNGEIEQTRHESYIKIFEDLKDLKPWEAQKR